MGYKNDCGVYAIRNEATGQSYVGATRCLARRRNEHRCWLENNTHHSGELQRSWNEAGDPEAFKFVVLERLSDPALMAPRERYWIESLGALETSGGLNMVRRFSDEARKRIGDAASLRGKGVPKSAEHKAKIGAAHKGKPKPSTTAHNLARPPLSEDARRRIGEATSARFRGVPLSPEHVAKSAASRRGRPSPLKGVPKSPEHKAKIAAAQALAWARRRGDAELKE